ncbi:MAG: class I SAM-dependent methyltransferase [bacterium]
MTLLQHAQARTVGHALAGQALIGLGRIEAARQSLEDAQRELEAVPRVTPGIIANRAIVAPWVEALHGELLIRTGKVDDGRKALKDVQRALRATPGPDAWIQTLFRLESIARSTREAGEWELAEYTTAQMIDHDGAYGGSHFAMALVLRHKGDTAGSEEIARKAGLNERYAREWLGAMVMAGVIEVDPTSIHYRLPAGRAAYLTRAVPRDNIAVFTQYIHVFAGVEDEIVECFKKGGGVPYEKFPRFHAVLAEDSGQTVLSSLETHILPLVPGLTGQLAKGIRMLDVGCGSGRVLNRLAELYPSSRFTGVDLSPEAIGNARGEAAQKGQRNTEFTIRDLSDFHETAEPEAFDFITTFDAIHDQAKPLNVLKGIHRALKADGVYLMQDIRGSSHVYTDIGHPMGTFLYTASTMYCMTVSLAQGGEGLGTMWGEEKTREYLQKAGFRSIETNQLAHDFANNWYVVRK